MLNIMRFKVSSKQIMITLILCLIVTSVTGLVFSLIEPYDEPYNLYIRLTDISWPPSPDHTSQKETYVTYGVPMVFELWNPSNKTYVHSTPHSNLLDPQMKIKLDENYTFDAGYMFWIHLSTHEIRPGVTVKEAIMSVQINVYNESIPPSGNYTVWAGIVGDPELYGIPPFNYTFYKTVIYQDYNDSIIEYAPVPENWGAIFPSYWKHLPTLLWSFSGVELTAIVYLLIRNYKKKTR